MTAAESVHEPVLYREVLDFLRPDAGGLYIDGTLGAGGHTEGLLVASAPDGRVLGLDRDPEAITFCRRRLSRFSERLVTVAADFAGMVEIANQNNFDQVNGILLDLGLSSRQLEDPERGFSFMREGLLDMRFDSRSGTTAAYFVNQVEESVLAEILNQYGEVRNSRKVARAIVANRPIRTTTELAELIEQVSGRRGRIHPATQAFQALRIAVNKELDSLEQGLETAVTLLQRGGRLAVITFHSLEDRLVKNFIREKSKSCVCPEGQIICTCDTVPLLKPITKKPVGPTTEEIERNPRSRSAKLRVAERI